MLEEPKAFALICWLLWASLAMVSASGTMPWPFALAIGASVYVLWRLYRRRGVVRA